MDYLKLENQLCFPLYVCSKEIIKKYKPFLDEINLTYTQYIVMLVMWEDEEISFKNLEKKLFLESSTLTPVLKKLESKGFLKRSKAKNNDKNLIINITDEGIELKERAKYIPEKLGSCLALNKQEGETIKRVLKRLMGTFNDA